MPERAWKCPDCGALAAESLIGEPPKDGTMHCAECGATSPSADWMLGLWEPGVTTSDSVALGGDIVGDGGPYERNSVILDTRRSVLLDHTDVAMMENPSDARRFASVLLQGRVNRSQDRSKVMYLMGADGAAALVSELLALAKREGGVYEEEFMDRLTERLGEMP